MSWKKLQDNFGKEIHSGTRKFYTCIIYFDAGWVSFFSDIEFLNKCEQLVNFVNRKQFLIPLIGRSKRRPVVDQRSRFSM